MAKRSRRGLSKKGLIGLKRVTKDNKRVWLYKGMEFDTLRDVVTRYRMSQMGLNL